MDSLYHHWNHVFIIVGLVYHRRTYVSLDSLYHHWNHVFIIVGLVYHRRTYVSLDSLYHHWNNISSYFIIVGLMYHRCTHVSLPDSCFIVFNVSFHVVTKQSQGTSDSNEPNFSFQQRLGHLVPGCRAHSMIKKGSRKLAEKCPFPCPAGPMVEVLQDQRVFEAPSNCQWTHPIKDLKLKLLLLLLGQLPQASNPKVLGT